MTSVVEAVEPLLRSETLDQIRAALGAAVHSHAVEAYAYFMAKPMPAPGVPRVISNYPKAWQAYYRDEYYASFDLVLRYAARTSLPTTWRALKAAGRTTPIQKRIFQEFAETGLRAGATIPLHGPGERMAIFSIASRMGAHEFERYWRENCVNLLFIAGAVHEVVGARLTSCPVDGLAPNLSDREVECLLWASRGKTRRETGEILGLGQETVASHIKNAMLKLGVHSKTHAVAKAVRGGLIMP